jgi:glycosyltransferase involved in cell wall biosynthesis
MAVVENKRLKNVIVVYDYAFFNGGAAKVAIQSAIALSKNLNINVCYFAAVGPICEELNKSKVHCVCLNMGDINSESRIKAIKNGIWNIEAKKAFLKVLERFDTEETIVHIHGWVKSLSASVVQCATSRNFKCVITLHDYFTVCPNGGLYNYQAGKICKIQPSSLKCYLCNCDKRSYAQKIWRDIRQILQNHFVKSNSRLSYISISDLNETVVRKFVRSQKFYRVDNPTTAVRNEHTGKSNKILYVGRLSEEKGADLFCECISELKQKNEIDLEGIVIGDGNLYDDLRKKYKDIVEFVGWKSVEDVQENMQTARALVLPSKWYEGAPLTIIEALMNGLPCVVSDCTSAVELIKDGVNGFVFKQGDVNSLENKITEIFDDTVYLELLNNIRTQFKPEDFSIEIHTDKLIEVYDSCLNGKRGE